MYDIVNEKANVSRNNEQNDGNLAKAQTVHLPVVRQDEAVLLSGAKNLRDVQKCFTAFCMTFIREKTKEEWRFYQHYSPDI